VGAVIGAALLLGGVVAVRALDVGDEIPEQNPLRIGVGADAESELLGQVLAELLVRADLPAEVVTFGHARDVRRAILLDEIDMMPSYTGAVWLDVLAWTDPVSDPALSYERVRSMDAERGLVWLPPTGANATFAFVVSAESEQMAEVETLEDLAFVNTDPDALLCVDPDFAERPDGLGEFARVLSISDEVVLNQVVALEPRETVAAVAGGDCVAGLTTTTDGEAWAAGLRPLVDPGQRVFPAFVVGAVVAESTLEEHPEIELALAPFTFVTTELLAEWNGRRVEGEPVEDVVDRAAATLVEMLARAEEQTDTG
jgi:osmoprotectant transport system substrate-binding protein